MVLYEPTTLLTVMGAAGTFLSGVSSFASGLSQANVAEAQAKAAEADKQRQLRDLREQTMADAASIRAALATSGGTPEAEGALQSATFSAAARAANRIRQNTAFRTGILSASGKAAATTGALSLLGGTLGAAYKVGKGS